MLSTLSKGSFRILKSISEPVAPPPPPRIRVREPELGLYYGWEPEIEEERAEDEQTDDEQTDDEQTDDEQIDEKEIINLKGIDGDEVIQRVEDEEGEEEGEVAPEIMIGEKWAFEGDEFDSGGLEDTADLDIVTIQGKYDQPYGIKSSLEGSLFQDLPNCRLMRYQYNAAKCFSSPTAVIVEEAEMLLEKLHELRLCIHQCKRPLIWISYSVGGIIMKQAFFHAWMCEKYRNLWNSTIGIIFLGTPHRQTESAKLEDILIGITKLWAPWLPRTKTFLTSLVTLEGLAQAVDINCESFIRLTSVFRSLIQCPLYNIYETRPTIPNSYVIVEKHSTLLGSQKEVQISVDTDHFGLLKPRSHDCDSYTKVYQAIQDILARQATEAIQTQGYQPFGLIPNTEALLNLSVIPVFPLQLLCPACATLSLFDSFEPLRTPSLEYTIDFGQSAMSHLDLWHKTCGLSRIIKYLGRFWLRKPTGERWISSNGVPQLWRFWPGICHITHNTPISDHTIGFVSVENDSFLFDVLDQVVIHKDPLSPPSIKRLREWLKVCDEDHEECDVPSFGLPTRVLDLQHLQAIKLRELPRRNAHYVALSHCWGRSKPFITTRETLTAMKRGFRIGDAPKTFRDAILVTRLLGVRYLWIDSLCIIQGDTMDWTIEGSRMERVYSNAYITIVAANSDDDTKGFLTPRVFEYTTLKIKSSLGHSTNLYLHRDRLDSGMEPVDTRGWTLQERYLSPRILSFGTEQITWICKRAVWKEGRTEITEEKSVFHWSKPAESLNHCSWYQLVTAFSYRSLTFDTDKLPAVAGIASRIARSKGFKYCAGLWWDDFPGCLLFRRISSLKPSEYVAPSWSWAGSNGGIHYMFYDGLAHGPLEVGGSIDQATVLGYYAQTPVGGPYMQVQQFAWLKLRAPVALIKLSDVQLDLGGGESLLRKGQMLFELSKPSCLKAPPGRIDEHHSQPVWREPHIRGFLDEPLDDGREIYALILAWIGSAHPDLPKWQKKAQRKPENWIHLSGIFVSLVIPSTHHSWGAASPADSLYPGQDPESPNDSALPTYERIGLFEMVGLERNQAIEILKDYPAKEIALI